ncbi:hypothetical protein [Bradyrhizobium diazoefficiens]|uniref:Uncharacterized protein n=1 Tax=Bradyrhizobium diazoefficiens TaxID=1355477 RepID=A0A809YH79_9BRAD|nr:hypothetical protein [Bradyrhizobium diazoefficiens]BCA04196.1 hypothetical protein H12S4_51000 [Bradyrhizobium diazoefficiens]BCA21553.1 hypothetical protein BDHH15_47680 [Bradyrhizobium diazoefficiens]BCE39722.1 hypothetical protein XF3B_47530 [Bradyrhizobium diazoefficiens]BCF53118.1 hypothetical protein XF17B_47560 [Bradyrhizobium diazoefficiens]
MTPDQALASHRRMLAQAGSGAVLVRRYAGKGVSRAIVAEASALAKVTMYKPEQLVGGIVQGDRKAIVLVDPDAAVAPGQVALTAMLPLSNDDKLVISGREAAIQGVDDQARRIHGVLIALEIQVRG